MPWKISETSFSEAIRHKNSDRGTLPCTYNEHILIRLLISTHDHPVSPRKIFCVAPISNSVHISKFQYSRVTITSDVHRYFPCDKKFISKWRLMIEWDSLANVQIINSLVMFADLIAGKFGQCIWWHRLKCWLLIQSAFISDNSVHLTGWSVEKFAFLV